MGFEIFLTSISLILSLLIFVSLFSLDLGSIYVTQKPSLFIFQRPIIILGLNLFGIEKENQARKQNIKGKAIDNGVGDIPFIIKASKILTIFHKEDIAKTNDKNKQISIVLIGLFL